MSVWEVQQRICKFYLYCNIDFFFHVFGNDDDTFTNGLFGMDCLQESKAVITSYILVLCSFQRPLISIVYFMLIMTLEQIAEGFLTTVFVFAFSDKATDNLSAWNHTANN